MIEGGQILFRKAEKDLKTAKFLPITNQDLGIIL